MRSIGERRADDAEVAVDLAGEVHGDGQDRRAGAQAERRRAGGQRGALAEELDLDAAAADVAVAQQAHDLVVARAPAASPGRRPVRAARRSCRGRGAASANHSNSSGGSMRSTTTVTRLPCVGEPAPGPLPAAEVRAGRGSPRCPRSSAVGDVRRSRRRRCRRRRLAPTATAAASSRSSSGRRSRTPPARPGARATSGHVGLTRRRWRSIIARRSGLAKLAPKPIGAARPLGDEAGHRRGPAATPVRYPPTVTASAEPLRCGPGSRAVAGVEPRQVRRRGTRVRRRSMRATRRLWRRERRSSMRAAVTGATSRLAPHLDEALHRR